MSLWDQLSQMTPDILIFVSSAADHSSLEVCSVLSWWQKKKSSTKYHVSVTGQYTILINKSGFNPFSGSEGKQHGMSCGHIIKLPSSRSGQPHPYRLLKTSPGLCYLLNSARGTAWEYASWGSLLTTQQLGQSQDSTQVCALAPSSLLVGKPAEHQPRLSTPLRCFSFFPAPLWITPGLFRLLGSS